MTRDPERARFVQALDDLRVGDFEYFPRRDYETPRQAQHRMVAYLNNSTRTFCWRWKVAILPGGSGVKVTKGRLRPRSWRARCPFHDHVHPLRIYDMGMARPPRKPPARETERSEPAAAVPPAKIPARSPRSH